MERLSFGPDAALAPADPRLERTTLAPLTGSVARGAPVQAAIVRIAPGGRVARHAAATAQLLAVLEGSGEASGATGAFEPVGAGDAVFWIEGEEHETRSEGGLTALILEGPGLTPFAAESR